MVVVVVIVVVVVVVVVVAAVAVAVVAVVVAVVAVEVCSSLQCLRSRVCGLRRVLRSCKGREEERLERR